jgi:hypothetical protein
MAIRFVRSSGQIWSQVSPALVIAYTTPSGNLRTTLFRRASGLKSRTARSGISEKSAMIRGLIVLVPERKRACRTRDKGKCRPYRTREIRFLDWQCGHVTRRTSPVRSASAVGGFGFCSISRSTSGLKTALPQFSQSFPTTSAGTGLSAQQCRQCKTAIFLHAPTCSNSLCLKPFPNEHVSA